MKYSLISFFVGILLIVLILFIKNNSGNDNNAINALKLQNDSLLQVNLKLDSLNSVLDTKIQQENIAIEILTSKDEDIKLIVNEMDKRIKSLNNKYEKATNHANDFGSNEIARYFSNL